MRDYSRRYSPIVGGKQKISGKKGWRDENGNDGRLWRMLGIIVTVAMVAGVAGSFWFGWRIRNGLDEIDQLNKLQQELSTRNQVLKDRRQQLTAEERIESVAKEIGLYPPAPKQIRRP